MPIGIKGFQKGHHINRGIKFTEEHRKKLSKSNTKIWLGKTFPSAVKEKMSMAHRGMKKPWVAETNRKRIISEQTRKKLQKCHLGQIPWNKNKKGFFTHTNSAKRKIGEAHAKERCHFWQGGKSFELYSVDWTKTLRRSIRERDKYTCQKCGEIQNDRAFDVHHIDYNKKNCNPDNLITLCRNCHIKTNFSRDYWSNKFN